MKITEDNYRHKGMRQQLVNQLRSEGFGDERVLSAINEVPRHVFLDSSFVEYAYTDQPFAIGSGQTISQPSTVAFQTALLQVEPSMKVLEIGTGSGYQACVLAAMGAKVFSIERQRAPIIPPKLIDQMKAGGIMVIPMDNANGDGQVMLRITKTDSGLVREEFGDFKFVPMLTGTASD